MAQITKSAKQPPFYGPLRVAPAVPRGRRGRPPGIFKEGVVSWKFVTGGAENETRKVGHPFHSPQKRGPPAVPCGANNYIREVETPITRPDGGAPAIELRSPGLPPQRWGSPHASYV